MSLLCKQIFAVVMLGLMLLSAPVQAKATDTINIASVGWTGVTIKTEMAISILETLGYKAKNAVVSVPIAYQSMSQGDTDAFLGNWMPSMANVANKYFENGSVIKYVPNMDGAQYTLAVPTYCAEAGLKSFEDLVKFGDKLDWKIYGIEAGNDGNMIIQSMIDKNMYGLGKFTLVASSEAAMLAQVQGYTASKEWIVFLGWAPHSMNERIDMTYLKGSTAETFGANDGMATVWTNIRKDLEKDQPNVARLFKNMTFPIEMMNQIMTTLYSRDDLTPKKAGMQWLKANPDTCTRWLEGVTTADGKPAAPVVEAYLKSL